MPGSVLAVADKGFAADSNLGMMKKAPGRLGLILTLLERHQRPPRFISLPGGTAVPSQFLTLDAVGGPFSSPFCFVYSVLKVSCIAETLKTVAIGPAYQLKVSAAKPNDLSSIPTTYMVGEN